MQRFQRIQRVYDTAPRISLTDQTKLVMISDCHRGIGTGADNFAKNQTLYYVALEHYDRSGFTYIELGDGDELWENRSYEYIVREYAHIFELLARLYKEGRMQILYGNHDIVKSRPRWVERHMAHYLDEHQNKLHPLFPNAEVHEGIVLQDGRDEILLLHGHQGDFFNDNLWRVAKALVRYLWGPAELLGVQEPFSPPKNQKRRLKVERKLIHWTRRTGKMMIAGHTHRMVYPKPGEAMYFNDGSCVHPRNITAIEIENRAISLVQWRISTKPGGVLFVEREVLFGPTALENYFSPEVMAQ